MNKDTYEETKKLIQTVFDTYEESELEEFYGEFDSEGLFYGWTNGSAEHLIETLKEFGLNVDSIRNVELVWHLLREAVEG